MKGYSWPSPRTLPNYPLKTTPMPRELVHAVGAVIIAWNDIEDIHSDLLQDLIGFGIAGPGDFRLGNRIIEPMGNRQRGDLFRGALSEVSLPEDAATALLAFQVHFDICLGNRNLIAHARYHEEDHGILISSYKAIPHISQRYIPDDAEFWETTIEEMSRLYDFGAGLSDSALALHSPLPLPKIPPPPRDLLKHLQVHRIEPRPPQLSGA